MNHIYLLLLILCINIDICGMKRPIKKPVLTITSSNDSHPFITLTDDIHGYIFSYIAPVLHWQKDYINLYITAQTAATLQQTCKTFYSLFSVEKIAPLLEINSMNKNILLIHTAEKGIPGLMQYALNEKADLNYINTEDGRTPLTVATQEKNYKCCFYLLEAGANVDGADINNRPQAYRPIEIATRNKFLKITKLLLDFKADINQECHFCHKTPLRHLLVDKWNSKSESAPIIKLLIDHGATIPEEYKKTVADMLTMLKQ